MSLPKFSIVMATFNSERTIEKSLKSLREQDYPQNLVEILVYDGGSTDKTREIAERYSATVKDNPDVEPVSAKIKGYQQATGKYLIYVDSDEVYLNPRALKIRVKLFEENSDVKICFSTGYQNPKNYPSINNYINSFGDPFTQFIYRISKQASDCIQSVKSILKTTKESSDYVVFDLKKHGGEVLFENAAMGSTTDLEYFKKEFPDLDQSRLGPVHLFYHMQSKLHKFAITKNDPVEHYSADVVKTYINKIRWRIINNIFYMEKMGKTGFSGRTLFAQSWGFRMKKYLYPVYTLFLLPLALDTLLIVLRKKDPRFFIHFPLSLYTGSLIAYYYVLKTLGLKKSFTAYGTTKKVS